MPKNKLARFRDNASFDDLHQPPFAQVWNADYYLKGQWAQAQFRNSNPITLELGCGRGEYTLAMATAAPEQNFVGMDIKGARIWVGAKAAHEQGIKNVAWVRARIETLTSFFAPCEISNLWITFPDPQLKERREKKRLTCEAFLRSYARILAPESTIHLKTDSYELFAYTRNLVQELGARIHYALDDIDSHLEHFPLLQIQTHYEQLFRNQGKKICYIAFNLPTDWFTEYKGLLLTPQEYWKGAANTETTIPNILAEL